MVIAADSITFNTNAAPAENIINTGVNTIFTVGGGDNEINISQDLKLTKLVAPSRCMTWCVGGKACGDSCISKDFTCRDPETREGANNLGRACDTSMYIRPCPSMPNRITNTQCDNMVADAAATAETCEESCCESSCQTWLFKEGTGCYHSDHSCTVMWQGIGGASGWNGGSAFLIEM